MSAPETQPPAERTATLQSIVRLGLVVAFATALLGGAMFANQQGWLSFVNEESAIAVRDALGPLAPLVLAVGYGVSLALWLPGTISVAAITWVYDGWSAIPSIWVGNLIGAALGYGIARVLGGDALNDVLGGRFALYDRYRDLLGQHGFQTVMYVRLVPHHYNSFSWLCGLSPISFRTYMLATAIGSIPGAIAIPPLIGAIMACIKSGSVAPLFEWSNLLALAAVVPFFFVPRLVRHARVEWGWFGQLDGVEDPG